MTLVPSLMYILYIKPNPTSACQVHGGGLAFISHMITDRLPSVHLVYEGGLSIYLPLQPSVCFPRRAAEGPGQPASLRAQGVDLRASLYPTRSQACPFSYFSRPVTILAHATGRQGLGRRLPMASRRSPPDVGCRWRRAPHAA